MINLPNFDTCTLTTAAIFSDKAGGDTENLMEIFHIDPRMLLIHPASPYLIRKVINDGPCQKFQILSAKYLPEYCSFLLLCSGSAA